MPRLLTTAAALLGEPGALRALLCWPRFSLTSYRMVAALKRQGLRPRTVIDIGANVGQFAVACARLFPGVRIHAFEPLPDCVERLAAALARAEDARVYPLALGEAKGAVPLHVNAHRHSSSVLPLGAAHKQAFPEAREVFEVRVPMSTLDDTLAAVEIARPCLLKVDVQGYEGPVLRGAERVLARVDHAVIECSFRPLYEGEAPFLDLVRWMETRGFRFLRPVGWLDDPHTGEVLQMDALFGRADGPAQSPDDPRDTGPGAPAADHG